MDHHRFDALTRTLAAGAASRRTVVRALVAAAGAALGGSGAASAAATCRGLREACARDLQCCGGSECRRGECRCVPGFTRCGRRCYDLQTDVRHCGECDKPCADCRNGVCVV